MCKREIRFVKGLGPNADLELVNVCQPPSVELLPNYFSNACFVFGVAVLAFIIVGT